MMHDPLIEIAGLHTHFFTDDGIVKAVDGVDLQIPRGKTLCVVGESGCGKSITASSILQLIQPPGRIVSGSIVYRPAADRRIEITSLEPHSAQMRSIRGGEIGMIFQEPISSLSSVHTIGDQICESVRLHMALDTAAARRRAIEMLERVGIPDAPRRIDAYPFELSGGMRQRAMIAMALSCEPRLLIADEPTTALDVTTQANILDLIADLQRELGMSVMLITHDLGVVAEVADEVAVMYLGQVVEHAAVDRVFSHPSHPYTQALMHSIPRLETRRRSRLASIAGMVPHPLNRPTGCPFHPRCRHAVPGVCDVAEPPMVTIGHGHTVRCVLYAHKRLAAHIPRFSLGAAPAAGGDTSRADRSSAAGVVLRVRDLKTFFPVRRGVLRRTVGHVRAVDGVSFDILEGETLGLVGESGCGKTTVGRTILRMYQPDSGSIEYVDGDASLRNLATIPERELRRLRRSIRMIFQDPYGSLNPRLPVVEIVGEVLRTHGILPHNGIESRVRELLAKVGLRPEYVRRYPHAFSGGERQRIGIARAIAPNPRLVVADEAVSALDVSVQAQTLNLLNDLQAELGLTYLFIAHDLSIVQHISDRVAVMYVGKIVEMGETDDLFHRPLHPYTEALLSAVPRPDPRLRDRKARVRLAGEVPDAAAPPSGCYFHPRCPYARDRCRRETPVFREVRPGRWAACHYSEEMALRGVGDIDGPAGS